ncbi:MAG: hypothetical protein PVI03_04065 [Candidatus Thorarchaeota archaeon]
MKNKYGYQVGDIFKVKESNVRIFSDGAIIQLEEDDGTERPLFKLLQGTCEYNHSKGDEAGAYIHYDGLIPLHIQDEVIKVGDVLQDDSVDRVIMVTEVRDLEEGFISGVVLDQGAGAFPKGYVSSLWKIKYHAPFTGTLTFGED